MTPEDLIADLRSRINPAYAAQLGTESYERRLCAEALEAQAEEIERQRTLAAESQMLQSALADLLRQVDEFCEREGEADFETGKAREALKRAGYWL